LGVPTPFPAACLLWPPGGWRLRGTKTMSSIWDKNGRISIPVQQRHIDKALMRDSSHCAVAMAIAEAIPDATFVCVDLQTIRWTRKGLRYCFLTPHRARDCIVNFDQGNRAALEPFELKLRPAIVAKSGKRRTHTPDDHELKEARLRVRRVQLHLDPEPKPPNRLDRWGKPPSASAKIALHPQSKDQLRRELEEAAANTAKMQNGEAPQPTGERRPRVARAMVSTAGGGTIPTTLGGKMPPVSILARREFGLRVLRK
jgi:hypothetical protein